jgi:hypothetical protein
MITRNWIRSKKEKSEGKIGMDKRKKMELKDKLAGKAGICSWEKNINTYFLKD